MPWEGFDRETNAVGQGFFVSPDDLDFILEQIKISEAHVAAGPGPANDPYNCAALIGGPGTIPAGNNAVELPFGLRVLDGSCNNLLPGNEGWGAANEEFIHLIPPVFADAEDFDPDGPGGAPATPTTYNSSNPGTGGYIIDSRPRTVSNLIVDQTPGNPAALAAGGGVNATVTARNDVVIENESTDEGLGAPFNDMLTFFGQFFDHGLDLKTTNSEFVYVPLNSDDPLYTPGSPLNFMLLSRTTTPGSEPLNRTTPYVDQNQTYGSHPSKQVFLREYETNLAGEPVSTGRLIVNSTFGTGMATWTDAKSQAATLLGIQLDDSDVGRVPMIATDVYGKFIPGPNGLPQLVTADGLVEGNLTTPVLASTALPTGHGFILDISNHAAPGDFDLDGPFVTGVPGMEGTKTPDLDPGTTSDGDPTTYDDEMLGAHFMAGDGRVNENIALTSVHHVFHSEHNRLQADIKDVLTTQDPGKLVEWQISPNVWNGERLFQAAKLITEMEYQHLAFEEFARTISPDVNPFAGYDTSINAAITAEFAHSVYRFGHSMLNDEVARFDENGVADNIGLIDAFLNPIAFQAGYADPDDAAGAVFRGGTAQIGQEIDEFVVEALRNNLLGLPLDLATINMARGREAGVSPLNPTRRALYASTNSAQLEPYPNWFEFGLDLTHQDSLTNFVAAYGSHPFIMSYDNLVDAPGSLAARREAATIIVNNLPGAPVDAADFMFGTGAWVTPGGNHVTTETITGLDSVDLWAGGLAEAKYSFGPKLGSTFNHIFEKQMENLQDGDRLYYLHRLAGVNLLASLEGNSFAELIERNTTATNLPADVFTRPNYIFDVGYQNGPNGNPTGIVDDPNTPYDETTDDGLGGLPLLIRLPDGTVRFPHEGVHTNMFGGDGPDRIHTGLENDTVRGGAGNDFLEGDSGDDNLIGGEGDDILTDLAGSDTLKGGPGNDALSGGPGFDLLQGGIGHDFIVQGQDISETLAGPGNDFIYGGDAGAVLFGDYGDDWLEGGGQADLVQGDNGNPFQNDPNGGHDVLNGGGGPDDYDSEGGDDILIASPGTSRFEGMLGFDWVTYQNFTAPVDADMNFNGVVPDTIDPLRDRFDLVEGLSGWSGNDTLKGDSFNPLIPFLGSELTLEGRARINGLDQITPAAFPIDPNTGLPFASLVLGDIILGGGGSDVLEGRGEDDIIDGDRWLNAQLEANGNRYDSMLELQGQVFAGTLNPGDISIVREIQSDSSGVDTAVFLGIFEEYDFSIEDGALIVDHVRGCGDPNGGGGGGGVVCPAIVNVSQLDQDTGRDTLRNIEVLQFGDGLGGVGFTVNVSSLMCDAYLATVVLGLGTTHPQFGLSPTIGNDIIAGTAASDTINDLGGDDIICGKGGNDTINASDGNDIVFGGAGNDIINGENGFDQLIGEDGNDTINGGNDADYIAGLGGDDILNGGDNGVNTIDIIEGGEGNDTIDGGLGNDYVLGMGGDDTLIGGEGADYLWGGLGIDTFEGNDGRDYLDGGDEDETMDGGLGDDIILGHGGADTLIGGPAVGDGSDYIWGGLGIDTFDAGDGPDYLHGGDEGETMDGGAGDDNVLGYGGDDFLNGGDGNDYVWGGDGIDTLDGGAGLGDTCVLGLPGVGEPAPVNCEF